MALSPIWISVVVLEIVAWAGYVLTRIGWVPGFLIFTPILIATSVGVGAVGGGVRNPLVVLGMTVGLAILLIGVFYFRWLGNFFG